MIRKVPSFLAVAALIVMSGHTLYSQVNKLAESDKRQIPISYIENRGQWTSEVQFMTQLRGMNVWLTNKGLKYDVYTSRPATATEVNQEKSRLRKISKSAVNKLNSGTAVRRSGQVIEMELVGASAVRMTGIDRQVSYRNYFIGKNPSKWQSNVPVYSKLRGEEVYPGVDVIYSFQEGKPRYDFVVKPGANPSAISLRFSGANGVSVSEDKGVTLSTKLGDMYNGNIYAYQDINGQREQIPCKFVMDGETVKFSVGHYDTRNQLIIDPLVYSTYFGGSGSDEINGIAMDSYGNVVVTGGTDSPNYPWTKGSYDSTANGVKDAFIAKFDKTATTLLFSTFIGGGSDEKANGVAIDMNNGIYICGETNSADLPASGWKIEYAGGLDAFITKVSSDGKKLEYCTYAGGSKDDRARAIAVTPDLEACVAGESVSDNFPTSTNAYKKLRVGLNDAIILKLRPSGASIAFSTYMGGSGEDYAYAIGCDGSFVYVGGSTGAGFPATYPTPPMGFPMDPDRVPYNRTFNSGGFTDGWVAKMTGDVGAFTDYNNQYITYVGASKNDVVRSLVVLKDGSVIIAGETEGGAVNKGFPHPSIQNKGGLDVFVSKLSYNGRALPNSIMFGGSGNESGVGVAISSTTSDVFVTGQTSSQDFQMSELSPPLPPAQAELKGSRDAFLARLPVGLEKVAYGTYLGGKGIETATSVVTTPRGDAYIAGNSASDDLNVFADEYQPVAGGGQDGFFSKIAFGTLNINTPNGGSFCPGQTLTVKWTKTDGLSNNDSVDVELSSNGGATWYKKIIAKPTTDLTYIWNIPANQEPGINYKIRLVHSSGVRTETDTTFTIGTPVQILENPVGDSVCPGTRVRFRVKGLGANLTYKWYFNGTEISGESKDSLVIASAKSGNTGAYKVDVSAGCAPATSVPVTLVVKAAPKVTVQPISKNNVPQGTDHTLKVTATGKNLTYEWYLDGIKLPDGTSSEYVIKSANLSSKGKYKVIVKGECGADTSSEAIIDVSTGVDENPATSSNVTFTLLSSQPISDELSSAITSVTGCSVNVSLTDNLGRDLMSVYNGTLEAGISRTVSVNVKNLSSGIYWLTAKCGSDRKVQKVEIVR